jgi:uncharacterized protein YfkK (UPF0435 family)
MDSFKEQAVHYLTRFYMKNTSVPFPKRYKKSKQQALEYINDMISKSKNHDEKFYWSRIMFYTSKINIYQKK